MSDRIDIKGIKAFGYHGVFEDERRNGQEFLVDVSMNVSLQRASNSDNLEDTVDYGAIAELVVKQIQGEKKALIERLAGQIADQIIAFSDLITGVAVTVHKPHAPVGVEVSDISVTVHRVR